MMKYTDLFEEFPDHSKVWIYQSSRPLNESEMKELETELLNFTGNWDSHGNRLAATAKVVSPYFSIVVVDQVLVGLCGGSVDSKVRFLKEMGENLGTNFFDRMHVTISENGEDKQIHFSELKNHTDALVYDSLITSLGDFRKGWPKAIQESNYANMI